MTSPLEDRLAAHGAKLERSLAARPLVPEHPCAAPRRRVAPFVTAALVFGAITVAVLGVGRENSPGVATVPGPSTVALTPTTVAHGGVMAFGDSVMMGAANALGDQGMLISAHEADQFADVLNELAGIGTSSPPPGVVVIHLGNNGAIDPADLDAAMSSLARIPKVVIVTLYAPRSWTADNNSLIRALPDQYANVTVLDWAELAPQCPGECFATDGIHLSADGATYYAQLIESASTYRVGTAPIAVGDRELVGVEQDTTQFAEIRIESTLADVGIDPGTQGTVVLSFGTTAPFTSEELDTALDELAGTMRVIVLTVRPQIEWADDVNTIIEDVAAGHTNATVLNWAALSTLCTPDCVNDDGTLLPAGSTYLAGLLDAVVESSPPPVEASAD